ncbi:translocation/assembly module TamB [Panacibacter ginsenosidivorans]|uniref:Translocation/assembly module TamB n=1 Tax=Panacibacter ginsenosidivorans TaxID=1813871 RepID=A0A5B8VBW8_9BACT|nr:translocation/assembly module TamB domain-containing protein [Panacibacter ginsenosidivorans]QEC68769.1 translocation/assembly module TamB [Panacibacter ginsenosidivorans]
MTGKKIFRKSLKIVAWIVGSIIALLLLILILIQIPAVQNFAKDKIVAYLENKIHTKVSIERLSIVFPKQIVLEHVYFEDQQRDTLLAGGKIQLDIAMLKLLSNKVQVDYLGLQDMYINVKRVKPGYVFNYDYIIKAFAPSDTTSSSSESSSMTFQLGEVVLKNIRLKYKDDVTGNDGIFRLGKLETNIKAFDPGNSHYAIPDINIEDISSSLRQYKPLIEPKPQAVVEAKSNEPINIDLQLNNIGLKQIRFDYINDVSAVKSSLNLGQLEIVVNKIDLSKLYIDLKKIQLSNTAVNIELGKSQQAIVAKQEIKKEAAAQANNPWKIEVAGIALDNNQLNYNDNNFKRIPQGIDYNHIAITGFSLAVKDLAITPAEYKGMLAKLNFKEQSGLEVKELHTNFLYNDKEAMLKSLVLKTGNSVINTNLQAKYPSIDAVIKNPALLYVDAALSNTSVAVKDILLIKPSLQEQLKGNEASVIKINGQAKGYVNNIAIPSFSLSGLGQTSIQLAGKIKGLPNAETAYYDMQFSKFNTTKKDILAVLPDNTLPDNIQLPDAINTSGFFKGTINNFSSHLKANTNKGNADLVADVAGKGKTYNIKATLKEVDIGYIFKQPENFGTVTMQVSAKGNGVDYKTMNTVLNANVNSATVNGYTYKDLKLDATLNNGEAIVKSVINDPNIRYTLDATANIKSTYPSLKMQLQLDTLNLYALHFMDSLFTLHTNINADMASTNADSLIGNIFITNTSLLNIDGTHTTDSIKIVAERNENIQSIVLNSEAANIDWKGKYKLTETGGLLMQSIKHYYNIANTVTDTIFSSQQWVMNILINPSAPLVLQFVPGLKGSDTLGAHIVFNSEANDLNIKIGSPHIRYGEQSIDNLVLTTTTTSQQLNYAIKADRLGSKSFRLYNTSVDGKLANNELFANILLKDRSGKDRYHLSAKADQPGNHAYRLSLNADSLLLNYEKWQVSNDNYIQYDTSGIIANNFAFSHNEQSLMINSETKSTTAPIDVIFKDFYLKTLTNFADQDSLFLDGVVNGKAMIKNVITAPVFTSDITIKDMSYKTDTIGNVSIKVDNETANAFSTNMKIEGHGNDVQLSGQYFTGESRMDLKLNINNIDLSTVKNFTAGQLKEASGSLKGNIAIAGTIKRPDINGSLHFSDASVTPTMLGEQFKLTNEEIKVNNEGIIFNNFTMADSAGNKAILNGKVITTDFTDYAFDLNFKADDFTAINSTKADNPLFYGKLNIDADVKIGGNMEVPTVKAAIRANRNTDFVLVLPSDDPEVVSREGVVNFINTKAIEDTTTLEAVLDSAIQYKSLAGADIDVTFETDTAAAFTLIIDERNGDALKVKGDAELTGGIDQSGKLTMTGNYELQQGSYQVTLSVLKKKFDIQKGSVITWKGDPTEADVNITALYEIKTAPIDLLEDQLTGKSETDVNKFKQKIPVQVFLKMSGDLLKPAITFDIALPSSISSQWKDVEDKLTQLRTNESEMNKQVFSLLLLGRFTQEDPFVSAAGGSNEALVRQSVSRILTDQLNKLASSLVKGVDINVGLNSDEDYSTGTAQSRTDLSVAVSKSLLNDRLRVTVGSDFQVEGTAATNQNTSNIAGDVQLDYQLTRDGRYRLRAYRVNKYEGVVEGQVVETGLTFVFTLDYDQFREIFNKSRKNKKRNDK